MRILEKWNMNFTTTTDGWFADWVIRDPKQVSLHLTAGWTTYQAVRSLVPDITEARELFGGMGAQSLMIQKLWKPELHVVSDYSAEAVKHLASNFSFTPGMRVRQRDAYECSVDAYDLFGLDFGDLTVWRTRPGEKHRALFDKVVAAQPKAFVLTDIAGPRLHLQRERYESLLGQGTCATYESYLYHLAARLEELTSYRYGCVAVTYHRWSAVLGFVRDDLLPTPWADDMEPQPTPSSPVGLVL